MNVRDDETLSGNCCSFSFAPGFGIDVQINFSTTPAAPDGLSSTFADNVGLDETTVYSGLLPLTGSTLGELVPRSFNTVIYLQTPFTYDPSAGNLLLDIRNLSGSALFWLFDAQDSLGDSISSLTSPGFFGVNSPTGSLNTIGLVTQFTLNPAPVLDSDGDGVPDDMDACPGTATPEAVPTKALGVNRFVLTGGGDGFTFDTTAPKGKGPQKFFTIEDTAGCSCEQIIEMLGLGGGHTKFGCSTSAMEDWIAIVNP